MRALVTGGAGFVGSHVCEALLAAGHEVVAVDSMISGTPSNVAGIARHPGFRLLRRDVSTGLSTSLVGEVDLVLHLACPASPADYLAHPLETLDVSSRGTRSALDVARACGARFVLASTSEVYGDPLVHPQREEYWGNVNPVGPRSVYDEGKRFAEALTAAVRRAEGVNTGIVRIFNTYGPRMRGHDGRVVPTFVRQALDGEPLTVAGDGSQTRSLCYVDDLVEGLLRFASTDDPGPVNLGNPEELTVRQIARDVIEATGSTSPLEQIDLPADDPKVRCPDISRARELLGWEPKVRWREGLQRTVAWFREARGAADEGAA
ncbi:SDR family NAD-dependent epimerase/dehydratase [Xylanimonas oleitrophica]|uniref:SDR family NAD-dependent epimerase/dehydratase n=1 Tax=Xylanimonas oleitrophica TaxID=2607479 RepID=A0A2W5Y369_9MICO|nr:UDP-glucuronic acid decarboxylase family protein [Xylanimonas oleitrophica]PZR52184.1 SDR family NAD-dependent epimerase/dehydratase [Xylanimonas oleitrophica]